jgi:hypothetical protein
LQFTVDGTYGRAVAVRVEVARHLLYFILCKRFLERDVPLRWLRDLSFSQRCLRWFKCSGVMPYRPVIGYRRLEGVSFSRLRNLEKCVTFHGLFDPEHEDTVRLFTSLHGVTSHKTGSLNTNS